MLDRQAVQLSDVIGDDLTKEQQEVLEMKGVLFTLKDGLTPARQLNGLQIQFGIDAYVKYLATSVNWSVVRSEDGEFIVPDYPKYTIMPLTPTIVLANAVADELVARELVATINSKLQIACCGYFFARDFSHCPGIVFPATADNQPS